MFTDKDRMDWLEARWTVCNIDVWMASHGLYEMSLDSGEARRLLRAGSVRGCVDAAMVAEQNSAVRGQEPKA